MSHTLTTKPVFVTRLALAIPPVVFNLPEMIQPPKPIAANLRDQFLLRPEITFLNHGSFGAVPRKVMEVQNNWRNCIEAEPIQIIARENDRLIANTKQAVGKLLGMNPADFGMVTNATEGVNAVLRSLIFKPDDEILTTNHVYNAVRKAINHVAQRGGAKYVEVAIPTPIASPEQITKAIESALTKNTRLVVVDHVTSPTALIFPVGQIVELCAKRGIDVLVDGAHAPGMIDLDISTINAAYYAGNLHKWVCAPKGSAFIHVRADKQAGIHPTTISHEYDKPFPKPFDWQGTRDLSAWYSIPEAINFMDDLGWQNIRAHNHDLAVWGQQILANELGVEPVGPLDGSMLGSMATLSLPGKLHHMSEADAVKLQQYHYSEMGIEFPLVPWQGAWYFRIACQMYNTPADIERLIDVLRPHI